MNHREILLKEFTKNRNKYIKPEREYDDFVTPIPVEVALEAMQQARINTLREVSLILDLLNLSEADWIFLKQNITDFKDIKI